MPATFTIVEYTKDNLDELLKDQPTSNAKVPHVDSVTDVADNADDESEASQVRDLNYSW